MTAHMTDGGVVGFKRSEEKVANDLEEAGQILSAINSGTLPPNPSMRICGRCPHFVSCPSVGAIEPI